jgi:hypothetical protein
MTLLPVSHLRGRGCKFTIVPPAGHKYTLKDGKVKVYTGKDPQGLGWEKEDSGSSYTEDAQKLQKAISRGWNHGLVCGSGGVVVFDGDDAERLQELGILQKIPPTIQVESRPGHRHHHLLCPELKKKFVIYDPILTEEKVDEKTGKVMVQRVHLGEVLGPGGHAVLPESTHPTGSVYHLVEDGPQEMAEISLDQLKEITRGLEYTPDPDKHVTFEAAAGIKTTREMLEDGVREAKRTRKGDGLTSLSDQLEVQKVLAAYGWTPKRIDDQIQAKGEPPGHSSESGDAFQVNLKTGQWHCKRCEAGGDLASLVGVLAGIISCTGHDELRGPKFAEVLNECEKRGFVKGREVDEEEEGDEEGAPEEGEKKEEKKKKKGPSIATQLVRLAITNGAEFWKTPEEEPYATIPNGGGHLENHLLRSKRVRQWLSELLFRATGKVAKGSATLDAITVLEGKAVFGQTVHPVFTRLAEHNGKIYLDLGDDTWRAVEIDSRGWRVIPSDMVPVRFRRAKGILPLPPPRRGGSLEDLRRILNVPKGAPWMLTQAWILQAMRPTGPYPPLIVDGEQGSGKSWLGRILRYIIDPNKTPLRRPPRNEHELLISATNSWVVVYDNLSGLPKWLGDSLCVVSTGGGGSVRELYSDMDETLFDVQRPVILNGIDELTTRDDLMGRAILLHLPRIKEKDRKTEKVIKAELDKIRPQALGAILDVISKGLKELPNVDIEHKPRMADFAEWITACEGAMGWEAGEFLKAFVENQNEAKVALIENDMFSTALVAMVKSAPADKSGQTNLEITSTLLLADLERRFGIRYPSDRPDGWPRSAKGTRGKVRRIAPALRAMGIEVSERRDSDGSKLICFKKLSVRTDGLGSYPSEEIKIASDGSDGSDGSNPIITLDTKKGERGGEEKGGDSSGGNNRNKTANPSEPSDGAGGYRKKSDGLKSNPSESDGYPSELDALLTREKEMDAEDAERKATPEPKSRDPTADEAEALEEVAGKLLQNWNGIMETRLWEMARDKLGSPLPVAVVRVWLRASGYLKTAEKMNGSPWWNPPAAGEVVG